MKKTEIAKAVTEGYTQARTAEPASAPAAESTVANATEGSKDLEYLAPTPGLNPRNQALKEIAKRANEDADRDAAETVAAVDEDGNPEAPAPAAAAPAEPAAEAAPEAPAEPAPAAPEPAAEPQAPASTEPKIDPNLEYTFVVEGVPVKFKGSQIISRVQKDSAAEYRLQLATQTLEEARRQVAAVQAPPTPAGAAAQPAAPAAPEAGLTDKQLADMLQYGDSEKAEKAIAEITRRRAPSVTLEDVKKLLATEAPRTTRHELMFQEATRFANTEYGDLLADPYLSQLFYAEEEKRRTAGNNKPYADLYREIGDDLRKHFNKPKPTGATPPAPSPTRPAAAQSAAPTAAQRQTAKAAAPAAPRLASARLDGGGEGKAPKTREQIIQGMQVSRGQRPVTPT